MKKILVILISLFVLVGCGTKSNDNEVDAYLNDEYKGEAFTVLSKTSINNIKSSGKCSSNNKGYKYLIKSNDTGIEFTVEDVYEASSYGTCNYDLNDNYKSIAMQKYIKDFGSNSISVDMLDPYFMVTLKVDENNFSSTDEMVEELYRFKQFYETKKPFMDKANVEVNVYKSSTYKKYINLSYNNSTITKEDIKNGLDN